MLTSIEGPPLVTAFVQIVREIRVREGVMPGMERDVPGVGKAQEAIAAGRPECSAADRFLWDHSWPRTRWMLESNPGPGYKLPPTPPIRVVPVRATVPANSLLYPNSHLGMNEKRGRITESCVDQLLKGRWFGPPIASHPGGMPVDNAEWVEAYERAGRITQAEMQEYRRYEGGKSPAQEVHEVLPDIQWLDDMSYGLQLRLRETGLSRHVDEYVGRLLDRRLVRREAELRNDGYFGVYDVEWHDASRDAWRSIIDYP